MHHGFLSMTMAELLAAVKDVRRRNRRCLEAFLERCQRETFQNPQEAIPLLMEAPEYVKRCRRKLGKSYPNYLVRAYGVLGSGLAKCGSWYHASQVFDNGRSVENADQLERAALECRASSMEVHRGNWKKALSMTDNAVAIFEKNERTLRDDCSLATALVHRGIVRGYAYQQGENSDIDKAVADFLRALEDSPKRLKRTRLAALAGIVNSAVILWFSGQSARFANPATVVAMIGRFRDSLRREDVPYNSIIDGRARWALGLALFKLMGGLSQCAEKHLRDARSVLVELGAPQDVAELTLDFHWCLIQEGSWAKALQDWSLIQSTIEALPEDWQVSLRLWGDALRKRVLEEEVVTKVFGELRGIRNVQMPQICYVEADDPYGW